MAANFNYSQGSYNLSSINQNCSDILSSSTDLLNFLQPTDAVTLTKSQYEAMQLELLTYQNKPKMIDAEIQVNMEVNCSTCSKKIKQSRPNY